MKLYIDCVCGCDILVVEKYWERDEENGSEYFFRIYKSSEGAGFFKRIQLAWRYFLYGEFAWTEMCVTEKDLEKIIQFLQETKISKEIP
jgi:hypothetical protein